MNEHAATYGIIGNPLNHSLSPVMHNAAFKALEVDAIYKPFPLEDHQLEEFFEGLKNKSSPIFGLNVTVPYKEKVIPFLDHLVPLAKKIKAVNTICIDHDRKLIGYNTDAPGFLAHLHELKVNVKDKVVAILGAGGSARAIIGALCLLPEKPSAIRVFNRTYARVDELLSSLRENIDVNIVQPVESLDELNIDLCDVLINTTSIGLKVDDACLIDTDGLHSGLFVYDLIYKPAETNLLKTSRRHGCQISNGLGMLYYQGVLAFQHWAETEIKPQIKNIMRNALESALD